MGKNDRVLKPLGFATVRRSADQSATDRCSIPFTKRLLLVLSLALLMSLTCRTPCYSEDLYVNAAATGLQNGGDWTNAWKSFASVAWGTGPGKLGPGDTLWIAGGTYADLDIGGSGTSSARIYLKRALASDPECTSAPGWLAAFDSQIVVRNTDKATIAFTSGNGHYVTIDGQVESGIKVQFEDDELGVWLASGADSPELRHLEVAGPGGPSGYDYPDGDNTRCVQATTGTTRNLLVSHCKLHGAATLIILANNVSPTIEYCELYDTGTAGDTIVHPNVVFTLGTDNGVFKFNEVYNHAVEGLFFAYGGQSGWRIHGNVFRDAFPNSYGRGVETEPGYSHGSHYIHNNVFSNLWFGVRMEGTPAGGAIFNNVFWNTAGNYFASVAHDYNYYSASTSEPHGIGMGSDPFVDVVGGNLRPTEASTVRDRGTALADSEYALDMDGNVRGADGLWDIGAFEYAGSSGRALLPPSRLRLTSP